MGLDRLRPAWLIATAALFGLMLLDIADVLQVPSIYWLAAPGLLLLFELTRGALAPSVETRDDPNENKQA